MIFPICGEDHLRIWQIGVGLDDPVFAAFARKAAIFKRAEDIGEPQLGDGG